MARYIVRVELHGAEPEDYEILHKNMNEKGYLREIQDVDGAWFHLPTAEYTAEKSSTAYNVREEVRGVASSVKTNCCVLVSETSDTSWYLVKK